MKTVNKLIGKILTGWTRLAAGSCLALASFASAQTQPVVARQDQSSAPQQNSVQKGTAMMKHASGTFDVKVTPQKPDNKEAETSKIGRMSLDKQFHGDLEATSQGEMLAAMSEVKGSAGYVAMERVNGKLQGRSGTFVLQHNGTMTRGVPQLSVTVVPDSGTGDLTGIAGAMTIKIDEGKHSYEFEYSLPDTH
jgi:Protein of unknown function (DUF3224)